MKPFISIVVPIYNMEQYLPRCLDSLLNQSLREIEVVSVNDGSSDGSLDVLEKYAAVDSRLMIVNSPNQGVSAARNLGLAYCRGEYIGFVDPDDWIDGEMYEEMLAAARNEDADIVMCAYVREFGTHSKPKPFPLSDGTIYRGDDVQTQMTRRLVGPLDAEAASPEHLDAWGTVWSKLYRAKLLRDAQCSFTDLKLIGSNEDTLFNIAAFGAAKSFIFLNRPYYHYWRANEGSITATYKPNLAKQFLTLYAKMAEASGERWREKVYRTALANRTAMNVLGLGLNIIGASNPASASAKVKELRALLREPVYREALGALRTEACPLPWRIFYGLAKRRLALPVYVLLSTLEFLRTKKLVGRSNRGTVKNSAGRHHHEPGRAGDDAHELLPPNAGERHTV